MTSTQIKPETDATPEPEPTSDKAQAFLDAVAQEAAEKAQAEEAELRRYKRLVRIEALKAQERMDWCDSGTNERLRKLGLREKGQGIAVRVRIEAVRETVIHVDAEDMEEATAILAEEPALVTKGQVVVRGWTVGNVEVLPQRDPAQEYVIGAPDETIYPVHMAGDYSTPMCEKYNSRHGYCTLARGHADQWHAVGDGTVIKGAWKRTD